MKFVYVTEHMEEKGVYLNTSHISQVRAGWAEGTALVKLIDQPEELLVNMTPYALMELITEP